MPVKLCHSLFLVLITCLCITCGKDNSTPQPQLVPVYSIFKLYHIEAGDSILAGDGSLDQTIEDKVKVTIKLSAGFRKSSGNYNVSIHELSNPNALANVGTMPASSSGWQSGNILSANGFAFKYNDLYEDATRFVKYWMELMRWLLEDGMWCLRLPPCNRPILYYIQQAGR